MQNGVVLALLAYAVYSCSDAAIKALSGQLGVFTIGFFIFAIAGLALLTTRPKGESWRDAHRARRPRMVALRAATGVISGAFSVLAFTTIPFADAYALIFLSPFFATLLSIVILKEQVGIWRWASLVAGFLGVMLVVRPGFRELEIGHLAAFIVAFLAAMTIILSRSLAMEERHTSLMGAVCVFGVLFNGAAATITGTFSMPTLEQFGWLALAGVLSAGGQFFLLRATELAPASIVAPTNYSQILWGIVLGAAFFNEHPDWIAVVGLFVVAASGLITIVRERIRRIRVQPPRIDRV